MKLKVGDELVCYRVCKMSDTGHQVTTKDKVYPIIGFDKNDMLFIKDDDGDNHYWSMLSDSQSYYGKYFLTPRAYKLMLIDKINMSKETSSSKKLIRSEISELLCLNEFSKEQLISILEFIKNIK